MEVRINFIVRPSNSADEILIHHLQDRMLSTLAGHYITQYADGREYHMIRCGEPFPVQYDTFGRPCITLSYRIKPFSNVVVEDVYRLIRSCISDITRESNAFYIEHHQ